VKSTRRVFITLTLIFVLIFSITAFASATNTLENLKVEGILYSTEPSTIKLPINLTKNEVIGILLIDSNSKMIASDFELENELLHINPTKDLIGEKEYSIRIFTKSGNKYEIKMIAKDTIEIDNNKESLIKVSAKPDKGFNYHYYLFIPKGT